jgi:hypothetical protein
MTNKTSRLSTGYLPNSSKSSTCSMLNRCLSFMKTTGSTKSTTGINSCETLPSDLRNYSWQRLTPTSCTGFIITQSSKEVLNLNSMYDVGLFISLSWDTIVYSWRKRFGSFWMKVTLLKRGASLSFRLGVQKIMVISWASRKFKKLQKDSTKDSALKIRKTLWV